MSLASPTPVERRLDDEHLRMLAIFHFVVAGFAVLGLLFLAAHFTIMRLVFANPEMWNDPRHAPPPPFREIFSYMIWFYLFLGLLIGLGGVGNLLSGLFLLKRKHRTFSLVVGALDCLQIPFGTVLGIFTLMTLMRPSVAAVYEETRLSAP